MSPARDSTTAFRGHGRPSIASGLGDQGELKRQRDGGYDAHGKKRLGDPCGKK
jgi:hypothetical protein